MATEALRAQVAAKWQESFNRMNKGNSGISGLMTFSQVRMTWVIDQLIDSTFDSEQAWEVATEFLSPKDISDPASTKQYSEFFL